MNESQFTQYYREYSKDVWDYLIHLPYMPSRLDRDELLKSGEEKRVKIWDYFFRINPADVGLPQKQEIATLKMSIEAEIIRHDQRVSEINSSIDFLKKTVAREKMKQFLYGLGSLLLGGLLPNYVLARLDLSITFILICISPLLLNGLIMFIRIVMLDTDERGQIRNYKEQINDLHILSKEKIDVDRKRIRILEMFIRELQQQIPRSPTDAEVRDWLNEDFGRLLDKSKNETGLGTRLLNIRDSKNPIPIIGPGELQHSDRIPRQYTAQIDLDLNKHLTARRAYYFDDYIEVLYGVYYLEHILIADDMLATYGLFYDFIRGKESSEQTTEQYYKDVVAIQTTKEFREISVGSDSKHPHIIYLDDAPTFTLSLADGEKRTVTFVNENYFKGIKEKIDISEDSISKIYWVRDAEKMSENAIKALRFRLRIHKGANDDNPDSAL